MMMIITYSYRYKYVLAYTILLYMYTIYCLVKRIQTVQSMKLLKTKITSITTHSNGILYEPVLHPELDIDFAGLGIVYKQSNYL